LAIALFLVCGLAHAATAQDTPSAPAALPAHQQQLSANPFGILFGLFNAEFERKVSESATLGLGGSFYEDDDDDYVNGDVFFRYYPSGHPLDSWSFGVKAGANDNFYLGLGFGLKRLFGTHDDDLKFIPTLRIVNIGVAF
jgi:hypothetical protein